jgi:hypothetical protein
MHRPKANTVKIWLTAYYPANATVILLLKKPITLSKNVQVVLNGERPAGLPGSSGGLIE